MRKVFDYKELNLPEKQQGFLRLFLAGLSSLDIVDRVVLFGSCAKGNIHKNSDIDLFVVTKREPTMNEEIYIMAECPPDYQSDYYIEADIIIKPIDVYEKHKDQIGMIQKYVEQEGADLTGLLSECAG